MAKRKLPLKDTPEAKNIIDRFINGERETLAKDLGYVRYDSLTRAMAQYYGVAGDNSVDYTAKAALPPVINLPNIKLQTYKPIKQYRKGDPETQGLALGDHHWCEITPTFNPDIAKARYDKIYKSTMSITSLHRNMYPINDLVIWLLGDMVHGENPYQGARVGSILCGAQEQIYDYALPNLLSLILSFKQEFKTVTVRAVKGNHGRYSKEAPDTTNWDMMLYKALKPLLERYGVRMEVSDDFCDISTIGGYKFFAFHGHQIQARQGIPYFALVRKILSWYVTYGNFDYALCGHYHKDDFLRISSKTKAFINGSLVSDDPFALEVIGTSSIPSQWTFGVHEKHGITWSYSLNVE